MMVVDADACFNKGVNKLDCVTAAYKQTRFDEIANVLKSRLVKMGLKGISLKRIRRRCPSLHGWATTS